MSVDTSYTRSQSPVPESQGQNPGSNNFRKVFLDAITDSSPGQKSCLLQEQMGFRRFSNY